MSVRISNFSNGWIIEQGYREACNSWLLIPGENLWSKELRGFLYLLAMLYIFLGVAIVSDVFMCSIEVITSKKKRVTRYDEEKQEMVEKDVLIWNETVANLTLMALGSSAPEIMLSVVVTSMNLGRPSGSDDLGTFTIIGSAAFNLLLITAICIISVPSPETKKIKELGVFVVTSMWSIFAYLWMLVVLIGVSPGVIEVWEAWVTFAFFPVMVVTAYCQDNHWWCRKKSSVAHEDIGSHTNIRVVGRRSSSVVHGLPKELISLEKERARSVSKRSITDGDQDSVMMHELYASSRPGTPVSPSIPMNNNNKKKAPVFARARFRHAAMKSMMGRRTPKFSEVPKSPEVIANPAAEDVTEKFTFLSPKYEVTEGTGDLTVEVLFHRLNLNGLSTQKVERNGSAFSHENGVMKNNKAPTGVVSVEYETREGSAKFGHNFEYTQGKLMFDESEDRKSITVPIIDNNQFDDDTEFYIILKNPVGGKGLGDPSVATVTIFDDDVPGVFQFDDPQCYADLSTGQIHAKVMRTKGTDGEVHVEYSTIDGSAKGGSKITDETDYVRSHGDLKFLHGETSKTISIEVNRESKGKRTFVLTLKNPTSGAKIGTLGATVCNITSNDDLANRLAGLMVDDDDDEPETWCGQFRNALILEEEKDEDGNSIPLKWHHYWLHFLTIFWKLLFALIPPRNILGAYPSFIGSLMFIGLLSCLLEQLGTLVGCAVGLEPSVAGVTIIAIGTSLPDTFASRTAALHDQGADAAIGNVTGSNSVNVFLGLGLPWVISSMYHLLNKSTFVVNTDNLISSVVIFASVGTIAIVFLTIRRVSVGGELGGRSKVVKWGSGAFLLFLWVIYITLTALKAYDVPLPW